MKYMVRQDGQWWTVYLSPHGKEIRGMLHLDQALREARRLNEQAGLPFDENAERARIQRMTKPIAKLEELA